MDWNLIVSIATIATTYSKYNQKAQMFIRDSYKDVID